jgi:hypothetical protein
VRLTGKLQDSNGVLYEVVLDATKVGVEEPPDGPVPVQLSLQLHEPTGHTAVATATVTPDVPGVLVSLGDEGRNPILMPGPGPHTTYTRYRTPGTKVLRLEFVPSDSERYARSAPAQVTFEALADVPTNAHLALADGSNGSIVKVDGVDIPRGHDQVVLYSRQTGEVETSTNEWGNELAVDVTSDNKFAVVQRNLRLPVRDKRGTKIPPDGFVISAHGEAGKTLAGLPIIEERFGSDEGTLVTLLTRDGRVTGWPLVVDETKPPVTPPTQPGGRVNNMSVWVMLWPNSTRVDIANLPIEIDEIRLAFFTDSGKLVGYGPYGQQELSRQLKAFLQKRPGRFISASAGGGGYDVDVSNPESYVSTVLSYEEKLGVRFDGFNVDWESDRFRSMAPNIVKALRILKKRKGSQFYCSWSPNGTYKEQYRDVCHANPDVVDELAFQNYDTPVTYKTASDIIKMFLGNGKLRPDQVGIGMMIENNNPKRWTLAQCLDYTRRLCEEYGVRKTNLWEAGRAETDRWARGVKPLTS